MKVSMASGEDSALLESLSKDEMANSTIIGHLGHKVLREVAKEITAASVCTKLEQYYKAQTLTNQFYLKGKLSGFKMRDEKYVEEYVDDSTKLFLIWRILKLRWRMRIKLF